MKPHAIAVSPPKLRRYSEVPRPVSRYSADKVKAVMKESRELYRKHHRLFSQGNVVNYASETPDLSSDDLQIGRVRVEFPKKYSNNESTQIDDTFNYDDNGNNYDSEGSDQILKKWAYSNNKDTKKATLIERFSPISLYDITFDQPKPQKSKNKKPKMAKLCLADKLAKGKPNKSYRKGFTLSTAEELREKSPTFFKNALFKVIKIPQRPKSVNSWTNPRLKSRFSICTDKL
ncbi:unnamed protein product [Blepharisma stoltei]|uniref:Uncharacterized protein n=1 Tax=Blepharisma stoltei TaxID=1481888 RepID=A0AAU9K7T9_9CILI|nr:unnamed protein product [Blepharisma stoltei]